MRRSVFSGLFERAFEVYLKNFKLLAFVSALTYLPQTLVTAFFLESEAFDITSFSFENSPPVIYAPLIAMIIFRPLFISASTAITFKHLSGQKPKLADALDASLMKWGKLLLTYLFYMTAIFATLPLIVVPIYLSVSFAFAVRVTAVSDDWGPRALFVSRGVTKGRWFSAMLLFVLAHISFFFISQAIAVPLSVLGVAFNESVIMAPVRIIAAIAVAVVTTYFEVVIAIYFLRNYETHPDGGGYFE
ncbi:MAG: hypothetical protein LBL35_07405 [Clostridiales bacterium]|jgi:hypothetical protein|nr:hypothetical protein [Clostridiales bacterium]